jgi:hypothetical protein
MMSDKIKPHHLGRRDTANPFHPVQAIAVLSFSDMACSLSLVPLASLKRWRGRSTAGPSH